MASGQSVNRENRARQSDASASLEPDDDEITHDYLGAKLVLTLCRCCCCCRPSLNWFHIVA